MSTTQSTTQPFKGLRWTLRIQKAALNGEIQNFNGHFQVSAGLYRSSSPISDMSINHSCQQNTGRSRKVL